MYQCRYLNLVLYQAYQSCCQSYRLSCLRSWACYQKIYDYFLVIISRSHSCIPISLWKTELTDAEDFLLQFGDLKDISGGLLQPPAQSSSCIRLLRDLSSGAFSIFKAGDSTTSVQSHQSIQICWDTRKCQRHHKIISNKTDQGGSFLETDATRPWYMVYFRGAENARAWSFSRGENPCQLRWFSDTLLRTEFLNFVHVSPRKLEENFPFVHSRESPRCFWQELKV